MKISREWLQMYFEAPLPDAKTLGEALTFHAFEIDGIENDVLDVKVTPNRGHDCLSYRGIAREVSAILDVPLKSDSNDAWDQTKQFSMETTVSVSLADAQLSPRYMAWMISGVKVGPSPKWLVDRLAEMGQQSINNVVDATNFVMFDTGQPLHAFDAGKLASRVVDKKTSYSIEVRNASHGEKLKALDAKVYELKDSMLVIVDAHAHVPIGIAGVKGGEPAGISPDTTDIIIESANFNGVSIRRTSQALKLRTDASARFEQGISPELAATGMRSAAKLITELAGGHLAGFADVYPVMQKKNEVSVTLQKINAVLGTVLSMTDVTDVFKRLNFQHVVDGDSVRVEVPHERLDISIPEDLVEEVGRIVGYDKVPAVPLPPAATAHALNPNFYAAEKAREELANAGYSEVLTSVFADEGERTVLNKIDSGRPHLRKSFSAGLTEAWQRNMSNKDVLGLDAVKIFEIGHAWSAGKESMIVATAESDSGKGKKSGAPVIKETVLAPISAESYDDLPTSTTEKYKPFSRYPAIVRDIALWVPEGTEPVEVLETLRHHAGELLIRCEKFDEFKKADKISYAFRLVFQSMDRTLFDEDANARMESIYNAVKEKGWEVR